MKRLIVLAVLALPLAGCNAAGFFQDVRDVEQQALEVIARVRAQAQVAAAEIDLTVMRVCAAIPSINATLITVQAAVPNPGPRTVAAINQGNAAMAGAAQACDTYASTPTAAGKVSLLKRLWAAYNAGKAAANAANAAAGA